MSTRNWWLLCLILAAGCLVLDYVTGQAIRFTITYILPIGLAAWYLGRWAGIGFAISMTGFRYEMVSLWPHPVFSDTDTAINTVLRLVALICMAWVLSQTRQVGQERELAQRRRAEEKNRLARKIQQMLFPNGPPRLADFDIGGACYPADATGGDYFDFIPMIGGTLGIAVGDVSGHGFGPALLMAEVHAAIRSLLLTRIDLGEILTLTNRLVCEDTEDEQFITVFLGCLDPHERTFVYASAGHQGFLLDSSGTMTKLDSTGLPLGIDPVAVIECAPRLHFDDGAFVLLFTDGIFEAMDHGGRLFGIERALEIVRANRHRPAAKIVESLCQTVRAFTENGCQTDDITAVVVKAQQLASRIGPAAESPPLGEAQGSTSR